MTKPKKSFITLAPGRQARRLRSSPEGHGRRQEHRVDADGGERQAQEGVDAIKLLPRCLRS